MGEARNARKVMQLLVAALVVMAAVAAGYSTAGAAGRRGPDPVVVGTVAAAAAQPTAQGRQIVDLQAHDGKVFTGFGDYHQNTGPISVTSFSPGGGMTEEFVADTEAVFNFRQLGGRLVAPSIDPRVAADYTSSLPWAGVDSVGSAHVFDMNTFDGADLWMVGSAGVDAVAWRSVDGGATWAESLRVAPVAADDFTRFYFAASYQGRLLVQAVDAAGGPQPTAVAFDGTSWAAASGIVPDRSYGWRPVEFGGSLFFHTLGHGWLGKIASFDGARTRSLFSGYDVEVADGAIWAVDDRGGIRKSTDGKRWQTVASVPGARSVTAIAGTLYVGTATSQVLSVVLA